MTTNSLVRVHPSMFTEASAWELVHRHNGTPLGIHSVPDDGEILNDGQAGERPPSPTRRFMVYHRFDGRLEVLALVD